MRVGRFEFDRPVVLAPMAGVTDRPFRILCKRLGADLAVSEMVTSNKALYGTSKSLTRMNHEGEVSPKIIQIAGGDVAMMVEAARMNASLGADIIDINMGCPAKKVCNKVAGSALLSDERLVYKILKGVVDSVGIPVTLKIRTGPSPDTKNGVAIAKIAQDCGVAMLSVHGRTRADKFLGEAEYETIASIVDCVDIPILANGDITTPQQAERVLQVTGADGVMVGRAAQGNPWIFSQIKHYLSTGFELDPPSAGEKADVLKWHLRNLYELYGEYSGVRIARKHIAWYCKGKKHAAAFRSSVYKLETTTEQLDQVDAFFRQSNNDNVKFAEGAMAVGAVA